MKKLTSRRKFIKTGSVASAGILSIALLPVSCAPYVYGSYYLENDKICVPKDQFGDKRFVIISPQELKASVLISLVSEGQYTALLMECTHKQCTVNPTGGEKLVCPCHGSEYDLYGKVLKSPAEIDLKSFKLTQDESNIYIF